MKKFILYWSGGKKERIEGNSIDNALTDSGYGAKAMSSLFDYVDEERDPTLAYRWNSADSMWSKIIPYSKIGYSFSGCVKSINDEEIGLGEVLMVFSRTMAVGDYEWQRAIDEYKGGYWIGDPDGCEATAWDLIRSGRIMQYRNGDCDRVENPGGETWHTIMKEVR